MIKRIANIIAISLNSLPMLNSESKEEKWMRAGGSISINEADQDDQLVFSIHTLSNKSFDLFTRCPVMIKRVNDAAQNDGRIHFDCVEDQTGPDGHYRAEMPTRFEAIR